MLPPESLPSPSGEPPAAMIAASPLLLTPGERLMSYGLRVPPCSGLQLFSPWIGGQFVFPMRIAPARRIPATTVASWSGSRARSNQQGRRSHHASPGELSRSETILNALDDVSRLDVEHLDPVAHELLELARIARKDGERAEVHGHDRFDSKQRHCFR